MSTPTRPVWALPAIGAGAGTLFGLLGGINVDDPNVVPSVKAKKLLRTLVLGSAIGLGTEAMLRGGGIVYKNLMSKSSAANPARRFRHKTLYSLLKQADTIPAIGSPSTDNPFPIVENVNTVDSLPEPDPTPTTPNNTPPSPNTQKEPKTESWLNQSPMGIPNGYLALGLGSLFGGGLLYHLLTEKKKRKPSGYLNAGGAGLLAGLLGYGAYHLSQGGLGGITGGNTKKPGAIPQRPQTLPKQEAPRLAAQTKNLQDSVMNRVNGLDQARPVINWNLQGYTGNTDPIKEVLNNIYYSNENLINQAINGPTALQTLSQGPEEAGNFQDNPAAYIDYFKNKGRQDLATAIEQALIANNVNGNITNMTNGLVDQMINQYTAPDQLRTHARRFEKGITSLASTVSQMPEGNNPYRAVSARNANVRNQTTTNYINRQALLLEKQLGHPLSPEERTQLGALTRELITALDNRKHIVQGIQNQGNYFPAGWKSNFWNHIGSQFLGAAEGIDRSFSPDMSNPDEDSIFSPFTQDREYGITKDIKDYNNASIQAANTQIGRVQEKLQNFYADLVHPERKDPIPGLTPDESRFVADTFPDQIKILQDAPRQQQEAELGIAIARSRDIDNDPLLTKLLNGETVPPASTPGSPVPIPTGTTTSAMTPASGVSPITVVPPDPYILQLDEQIKLCQIQMEQYEGIPSVFGIWQSRLARYQQEKEKYLKRLQNKINENSSPEKTTTTPKPTKIIPAILRNDPTITGSGKQEKQPVPQVQPQENNTSYIDPVTGTVVVGTGLGAGAAGLTWGLTPSKTPERTLDLYSTPNGNNAWSVENIKTRGTVPAKDELQRLVNLRNGNISPEEYLIPGRSEALENISSRITTNNRGLLGDPAVVNYEEVQKLAKENITRLGDEIEQVKNYINQEYTSKGIKPPKFIEEKTNARLSKLNAKIKQWEKIGLAGTEIVHTPEEIAAHNAQIKNLNNQIINIKDEALNAPMRPQPEYTKAISDIQEQINTLEKNFNTKRFRTPSEEAILNDIRAIWNGDINIPKAEQEALEALNNRLQQIESFSDLRKANGESIRALKQEAIMDFANKVQEARAGLTGEKSNPIYSQWKQQATDVVNSLKINGERLPWKYRLSTAEIADIADSPLKQAILEKPTVPGMSFKDAVTYLNDPELLKASKQLKDANAHLQEVQRINQTKIKAGIKPNPLDEVRAQKRIELAQNRIQQLKAQITYGHIYGDSVNPMLKGVPINSNYAPEEMVKLIEKARIPDLSRPVTGIPKMSSDAMIAVAKKRIVLDQMVDLFGNDLNNPEVNKAFEEFKDVALKAINNEANSRSLNQFSISARRSGINNPGIEFLNELVADAKAKGDPYLSDIIDTAINNVNKNKGLPVNPISKKPSNIHIVDKPVAKAVSPLKKILAKGLAALTPIDLIRRGVDDATTPYTNNKEKVFSKALDNRSFAEREAQAAYDRAIAQGKSKEEALREANGMFGTSVALGGAWGLVNRIPALAVETVNIPSYLYNLGEEGASLAGLKTDKLPVTDTDKITLYNMLGGDIGGSWGQVGDGLGQGMGNLIPIVGQTAKHVVTRPIEAVVNTVDRYASMSEQLKALKQRENTDAAKEEKRVAMEQAAQSLLEKQPSYRKPKGQKEIINQLINDVCTDTVSSGNGMSPVKIPNGINPKDVTPELIQKAINYSQADPVSIRVNTLQLPKKEQIILYRLIKSMNPNAELIPL